MKKFISLRYRVLLLLILAVIPVLLLMIYDSLKAYDHGKSDIRQTALRVARLVQHEQRDVIVGTRNLLPILALHITRHARDAASCNLSLTELLGKYTYYSNFGVADADGLMWCSGLPMPDPVQIQDRSYFRHAMQTGKFSIGEYQIGRITKRSGLNFGYPLLDEEGNPDGVFFAAFDLAWLSHQLKELALPVGTTITIFDEQGTVLVHSPEAEEWVGKNISGEAVNQTIIEQKQEGAAVAANSEGEEVLYAFTVLDEQDKNRVFVRVGIPLDVAYGHINEAFIFNLQTILFGVMAVITIAWFGTRRFILDPVGAMTGFSKRLSEGSYDARIRPHSHNDELTLLANTFNGMAATIQQRHNDLALKEWELRRANRALHTLSAGNKALVRAKDEQELLTEMCRVAVHEGGYSLAWVEYRRRDTDNKLEVMALAGGNKETENRAQSLAVEPGVDNNLTGEVLRTGKIQVVKDLQSKQEYRHWHGLAQEQGVGSVLSLPLNAGTDVFGVLTICDEKQDAFDSYEIDVLSEMSQDLAYGINALRIHNKHEEAQAAIQHMAYHDDITGLPNHVFLEEELHKWKETGRKYDAVLAVLLFDISHLQDINDTLGFEAGNKVMRESAQRIERLLKEGEVAARMRGDEFAVLLTKADKHEAEQRTLTILNALNKPTTIKDIEVTVRARSGIVLFPQGSDNVDHLIRHADIAMNLAKGFGKEYMFYSAEQDPQKDKKRHLRLATDLQKALQMRELSLFYQPKISMNNNRICGFEALARWQHQEQGMISPGEFIEVAEYTGMISTLTNEVLEMALEQSYSWAQDGLKLPIAVNLSARDLLDPKLLKKIDYLCMIYNIEKDQLEVEITESALMEDPAGALQVLLALKDLGIALYIDDFGTGYSSLSYLRKLPMDALKIDMSFVMEMLENKDSATIVRSTISMAHDLGLRVVAEGVENKQVWDELVKLGCDSGQGFYMGKPMPIDQIDTWLQDAPWGIPGHSVK